MRIEALLCLSPHGICQDPLRAGYQGGRQVYQGVLPSQAPLPLTGETVKYQKTGA